MLQYDYVEFSEKIKLFKKMQKQKYIANLYSILILLFQKILNCSGGLTRQILRSSRVHCNSYHNENSTSDSQVASEWFSEYFDGDFIQSINTPNSEFSKYMSNTEFPSDVLSSFQVSIEKVYLKLHSFK